MIAAADPRRLASSHVARQVAIADAGEQLGEPFAALPSYPSLAGVPEHF
jgi:hypothetical protein